MQQIPAPHEELSQASPWQIVIIVFLVGVLTVGVFGALVRQERLPPMRLTEGRLSWQKGYAIYPTRPDRRRLLAALKPQASTSLNDRVLYYLLTDNLDRAVADMEDAVRTAPGQALLLSDLSALYTERARAKERPEDYLAALEMAERAVAISPNIAEVSFNYAIALENLFLYDKAFEVWSRLSMAPVPLGRLPMEPVPLGNSQFSGWHAEAREHRGKVLTEAGQPSGAIFCRLLDLNNGYRGYKERVVEEFTRCVTKNPEGARAFFQDSLLPDWAWAVTNDRNDKTAARQLTEARLIAEVLAKRGDRILLRIAAEMESVAARSPDRRKSSILIHSLRLYGRYQELRPYNCNRAMEDLEVAERDLQSIGSAAEGIVSLLKAYCQLYQDNFSGAQATLDRMGRDSRLTDYSSLEGWQQSYLAFIARKAEDLDGALAAYRRAYDLFHASGEVSGAADMQNRIADVLDSLGQRAEAWRYRYRALAWARRLGIDRDRYGLTSRDQLLRLPRASGELRVDGYQLTSRNQRQLSIAFDIFDGAAQASLAQRRPEAALHFQSRAVFLTRALKQQRERTALALLTRARIKAVLGRQEAAKRDFQDALNFLPSERNWASELLATRIDIVRSEIADAEGRASAIASESFAPEYLDQQADADFRRGHIAAAEKSLERSIDELEQRRKKVVPGAYRISYFDQARPLYDRLIALQVYLAQPEKALEVLERFRSRALRDQIREISGGSSGAESLSWRDLCQRIPEGTFLSVYGVVDDRLVTWLVWRSGVRMIPYRPDWPIISSWAQRLWEPQVRETERKELLTHLYKELVAPWKGYLGDCKRIIFVPVGNLHGVPFAALLDSTSGIFLIQEHVIGVAPSVSEYVAAVERDRLISAKPLAKVLLVGDPVRHDVPSLPGSMQEIQNISDLYHGFEAQVLTRAKATPGRVMASLGEADIAHLAVHALQDYKDPTRSRLLLSSSRNNSGELSARDLLKMRFSRTRLVILAACGTHAGPISESEGSLSLSRSFLAAGIPAVVGSLRGVVDESTARISVRFHQELLQGVDALTALRWAQIEEIAAHRSLSDWTWASFQVYGGVEERYRWPD